MGLIRRNARKFTKAESFQSFMEGVRALQSYDEDADKAQLVTEQILEESLRKAEHCFQVCVSTYPKDILPRYYLGIVLSIEAQIEQARQLRSELTGTNPITMPRSPDALFLQAAAQFEQTAAQVGGDLLAYAQYNQAQALAKTGPVIRG